MPFPSSSRIAMACDSNTDHLRIWVGCYNLGNAEPDEGAVYHWLLKSVGFDLVVVGLAEAHYTPGKLDPKNVGNVIYGHAESSAP